MNWLHNKKGQTLLELIVAISILIVALVATIVLIVSSINAGKQARNKLIATSLAREGIETVRNIRDSNWLDPAIVDWDDGLQTGGADNYAIPIIDGTNPTALDFSATGFNNADTEIKSSNNFFIQGNSISGGRTSFYRLIYISSICHAADDDESIAIDIENNDDCGVGVHSTPKSYINKVGIRVVVEVRWPSDSSNKSVSIEDRLYNWQAQ